MGRAILGGFSYFGLVFVAGFVLGTIRTLWLAPALGSLGAVLIELPVILALAWLAALWTIRRLAVPDAVAPRALMGALAFVLLMAAELALSVLLFGRSIAAHWATYGEPDALVGLAGQVVYALLPLVVLGRTAARERTPRALR